MNERDNSNAGRKPDFIAYQVNQTQDGKGIFNRIGAAWAHKDGQGFQIQLDSMPVDGRVTLRELREERMQGYEDQRQAARIDPPQERSRQRERTR